MPRSPRSGARSSRTVIKTHVDVKPARHAVTLAVSAALCTTALYAALPSTAHAQTAQVAAQGATQTYGIPAGPLAPALHRWASASNALLSFTPDQTNGKTTAGVSGKLSADEALKALLAGSGLRAVRWPDGSYGLQAAEPAVAQSAGGGSAVAVLPTTNVTDDPLAAGNLLHAQTNLARMSGTVHELPQVVSVVPQEMMQQQQVTTLEQALRNVPGITVAIGEANGGANGDQFRIRGSTAKNDAYLDGLRDFGVYVRDTFNTEQVDVIKGPSSENFGMGSNGGAINSETKLAHLGEAAAAEAMVGNGPMNRQTVDLNHQLTDTTALRLNAMRQDQTIVDRDNVKSDRWGLALSFAAGLGTDTNWYMNYMHQTNDRTPDYGQPLIGRTATSVREPVASAYGVDRSNYYGKDTDRDYSTADIFTSLFKHKFNEDTSISNDTRFGYYERMFSATTATCDQTCANSFLTSGDGTVILGSGGGPRYFQRSTGAQNITTLKSAFDTAFLKHDVRLGLDLSYQTDHRQAYAYMKPDMSGTTTKVPGTLNSPNNSSSNYIVAIDPNGTSDVRDSTLTDVALFASDRVHFAPQWSVLGSVRWDYYSQTSRLSTLSTGSQTSNVNTSSNFFSPKLSLIWEPNNAQSYYLSYGWASTTPWAGSITADANPLGVNSVTTASDNLRNLSPEKTKTLELGGKVDLANGRVGLSGAVFHTEKNNSYYDDGSGNLTATGNKERYYGIELGLSGTILPHWTAYVGYTWLHSEIVDAATKTNIGNPVQGAARNSATLWTTYDLTPQWSKVLPGRFMVGGGVTYRDSMYIRDDMMAKVPYSLSFDAMLAWEYKNVRVALNGYNLANRINYDNYFAGENANTARAIPSAGRTFILSTRISM
ncbi:TonB-dependent receptor [Pandoraea captiosa]|uniref:TonB-dependent receptor n=1 Tax=Pandoraea captiosa TaxID=2508302 RepID=A0A5E4ZTC5_9BURK|nr:TonB-dependent siderophore receptor [Pandoraea captiosa]VVE64659.1 TonB-dependent receptor [Pandoraea captiosa]